MRYIVKQEAYYLVRMEKTIYGIMLGVMCLIVIIYLIQKIPITELGVKDEL
jgi:hypothetical protein